VPNFEKFGRRILKLMGRITTPLLKLPITKIVVKVNKNDVDLFNYNLPERDEFVTKVILIRVMIKFNKGPLPFKVSGYFTRVPKRNQTMFIDRKHISKWPIFLNFCKHKVSIS
jgi:hypothetical protein